MLTSRRHHRHHHRLRGVAIVLAAAVLAACSSASDGRAGSGSSSQPGSGGSTTKSTTTSTTTTAPPTTTTTAPPQLPGGGREILPGHRVVAYYGNSQSAALGVLGETGPQEAAPRLAAAAAPFATPDRPVLGAFELIVSVVQGSPGPDGDFTAPSPPDQIQAWLDAARANKLLLILDVQPGRASFVDEVKRYEHFLREPDVSLALDPEWRMGPTEIPGRTIGSVDVAEVNEVSAWLSDIVAQGNLPQKLFVVHQFTSSMITNREALSARPGLATVVHIDGFGTPPQKLAKYRDLQLAPPFYNGFKLFYDEDTNLLTPAQTLTLQPPPDLITYQ